MASNNKSKDSLTDIKWVGASTAKKLAGAGFSDPASLASASVQDVADVEGIGKKTAKKLVSRAKKHAGSQASSKKNASASKNEGKKKSIRVTKDSSVDVPSRPSRWKRVGIAAALVILVALGVMWATGTQFSLGGEGSQPVAAVDGEVITQQELDSQYSGLPAQMQQQYTKQDVLTQLVDKQLILQHADQQGVTVSDADVEARIDQQAQQLNVSREQLTEVLAGGNVTLAEYKQAVREELVLQQLLEDLQSDVQVSDEEVRAAYEQLPEEQRSSYEQMSAQIRSSLEQRAARQAFSDLLDQLRQDADIDYYGQYQSLNE